MIPIGNFSTSMHLNEKNLKFKELKNSNSR